MVIITWKLILKRLLPTYVKALAKGSRCYFIYLLTTWKKELMDYIMTLKLHKVNQIIKESDNEEVLF